VLFGYFTEQPYYNLPWDKVNQAQEDDHPAREPGDFILLLSNKYYVRDEALRLYHERIEEYRVAEASGFDAIMLNEHHAQPYCMQARVGTMASYLAGVTSRVKIIQLGTPLPVYDNPVQVAEELAMIDMFSKGRLITGIVRGGGPEQLANDANPAFNQARFREAHDLIIKTWTQPGPFRWDGEHFHARLVNPWILPVQKPHPPIFVPGVSSQETIKFAAEHAYPYVALSTGLEATEAIWNMYKQHAREVGYEADSQHFGYLANVHVAETEEQALENAKSYFSMGGTSFLSKGHWTAPTGYQSWESRKQRMAKFSTLATGGVENHLKSGYLVAGTPKQVVEKLRFWIEKTRPGTLIMVGNSGSLSHEHSKTCIRLLGEEVIPQLREIAANLGIRGPFDNAVPEPALT
jgi:alkanesulfonate monooxygenase SsuD/methylene tetrahydromethanopterin reductase-like flavin-dependent oxidoreductase (luciferase family)